MSKEQTCCNCIFACWYRLEDSSLHPSEDGLCSNKARHFIIPKAYYFAINPAIVGGGINRHEPHKDCPCWKEKR